MKKEIKRWVFNEENHLTFLSISGSLLAYLQCIYITSCFPSKNVNVFKIMCSCFLICFDHFYN